MNKLWTKNFTIITLGSVVSMLGNAVSGFAINLYVLDTTNSIFLYALFMIVYSIPHVFAPTIAGPFLDRFSRRKAIYTLDFISTGIYIFLYFFLKSGYFSYPVLLIMCLIIGSIDGIYMVAYDSLYPNLVSKGNFTKAYSISSMIYPLASFMVPVASYLYNIMGKNAAPLFLFNAVSFFIAACFETQIKCDESYINKEGSVKFGVKQFSSDLKEGIRYIISEKGLFFIVAYFAFNAFTSNGTQTLLLPFFNNNPHLFPQITIGSLNIDVITMFTLITGMGVLGRLIGGAIHYWFRYPVNKKFAIALIVYTTITVIESVQLFLPIPLMMLCFFIVGIMGVTSFNIRISGTQSYVPDDKRGRFNGSFQMLCTIGGIAGQLVAGILGDRFAERPIIIGFMVLNMFGIIFIMYRGREHVKKIYNTQA